MSRLLKLIAIPAVMLAASFAATPSTAQAGYGYGYGFNSYYRPIYSYNYYTPTYYSYPTYYGGFCY